MSRLDKIWARYELEKTPGAEDSLCHQVRKLANIVLKQISVNKSHRLYDDLIQRAYIVFFELVPKHDPKLNSLDGYFMAAYRKDMIKLLNDEVYFDGFRDKEDDSMNPEGLLLVSEMESYMRDFLDKDEWYIFDNYMRSENYTVEEIAEEEGREVHEIHWVIATLRTKVRHWLKDEEHYYEDKRDSQECQERPEDEDGDCRHRV
jgi:DNA-directed RNA polymerase specialized sigma subunit